MQQLDNVLDNLLRTTGGSFETLVSPTSTAQGTTVQLLQDNGDTIWPGKGSVSKDCLLQTSSSRAIPSSSAAPSLPTPPPPCCKAPAPCKTPWKWARRPWCACSSAKRCSAAAAASRCWKTVP
ncbi:hypothetical protein [Comamonas sp. JC664]|uniref:hypothetical protein n=1 Tax=Comamonas sp. JC664 TaxID=2801917 RepID=UPI00361F218E